jgi:hypothetical protein
MGNKESVALRLGCLLCLSERAEAVTGQPELSRVHSKR